MTLMEGKIVVSLPKPTHLKHVELYASRRYGGQWKACKGFRDCWPDEENKNNFCWILEREVKIFDQDLKRYDEIQRLNTNTSTPDPIPKNDPRWSKKRDWRYGAYLLFLAGCVFVVCMFYVGVYTSVKFVFSYKVPVISADTEHLHQDHGRLR